MRLKSVLLTQGTIHPPRKGEHKAATPPAFALVRL
nr:MAG TPA: hypothetical protein [Caudoviricetes sp.]DAU95826.1 MAG TPA: hypothetical protein [Caudoviricetes sp.]